MAVERRERGVGGRRHVEDDAVAAAVFGDIGDAQGGRPVGGIDGHGLAAEPDLAGVGGRQAEQDACQLGPARADQAGQPEDLAGPNAQGDVAHARRIGILRFCTSSTTSPGSTNVLGNTADSSRPTIMRIRSPATRLPSAWFRPTTPSRRAVTRSAIWGSSSRR